MNFILAEKGLQGVINAINNVIDFFETIIKFISNFFKAIIKVFEILITMVGNALTIINSFPSWLKVFGILTIAVTVIYFIANRETGK